MGTKYAPRRLVRTRTASRRCDTAGGGDANPPAVPVVPSARQTVAPREVVRRHLELMNRGDWKEAAACRRRTAASPRNVARGKRRHRHGPADSHGQPPGHLSHLSGLEDGIIEMVAEGESVVVRCRVSGTHLGVATKRVNGGFLVGVEPTRKRFEVQHIHWYKVRGGRITDHFTNRDDLGMTQQLASFLKPIPDGRVGTPATLLCGGRVQDDTTQHPGRRIGGGDVGAGRALVRSASRCKPTERPALRPSPKGSVVFLDYDQEELDDWSTQPVMGAQSGRTGQAERAEKRTRDRSSRSGASYRVTVPMRPRNSTCTQRRPPTHPSMSSFMAEPGGLAARHAA